MTTTQLAKYVQGSIPKHLLLLTITQSIGLITIFMVDFVDTYFLGQLHQPELLAAVGFASSISMLATAIGIGLAIAGGATVSQHLGRHEIEAARAYANCILIATLLTGLAMSSLIFYQNTTLLSHLGATGLTLSLSSQFLKISCWTAAPIMLSITGTAILRSHGIAIPAMIGQICGGLLNAILNPTLIIWAGWGIKGSAMATLIAMCFMAMFALTLIYRHQLYSHIKLYFDRKHLLGLSTIALPAMTTNLVIPLSNTYVISQMSPYGQDILAGTTVLNRMIPIAFVGLFSLSGAIAPIIGQNFGAKRFDRIQVALTSSATLALVYTLIVCTILWFTNPYLSAIFHLPLAASQLILYYCSYLTILFFFNGLQFSSNACFNNIGVARYAMISNILKATFFTVPFVYFGQRWNGSYGLVTGQALGSAIIGLVTFIYAKWFVSRLTDAQQ